MKQMATGSPVIRASMVYAVMLEFGLNRTEYGKVVLAACFVNDRATVLALGLKLAPFGQKTLVFAGSSAVAFVTAAIHLDRRRHRERDLADSDSQCVLPAAFRSCGSADLDQNLLSMRPADCEVSRTCTKLTHAVGV